MINKIFISSLLFSCLFIGACKKDAADPSFTDTPIIESYLNVGSPAAVKVSKLISFDPNAQYSNDNVEALNINIICNNNTYTLNSIGGGNYADSSLIINDTTQYSLQFNYNGKAVTATTKALSKPSGYTQSVANINMTQIPIGGSSFGTILPDPIILNWNNPDHSYYIIIVENTEINPELINLNESGEPNRIFRNEPTQDITYQLNARQFHYFGMHKITLYHIQSDYADLYKNNGTSSQNLTVPSTNIYNGLGIFTAMNSTILYVNVHKL